MVSPPACEMDRLPEELLVKVVSLTSPIDACRAASVSKAFRATASSDAVWSRFLPRKLPQFAKGELPRKPMSKKELFRRLSGQPALFPGKMIGMQLDRSTGTERLTLSSRALQTPPGDKTWRWIHVDSGSHYSKRDRRFKPLPNWLFFSMSARFRLVDKLEIRAKIQRNILSPDTTYVVYTVFRLNPSFDWPDFPIQEASIGVAGRLSTRQVCLQGYVEDGDGAGDLPQKHIVPSRSSSSVVVSPLGDNVYFPRRMADGWMEVELGELQNREGDGGDEVLISLTEKPKSTMVYVWVLELRSKIFPPTRL